VIIFTDLVIITLVSKINFSYIESRFNI